jgi:hypothetical protein
MARHEGEDRSEHEWQVFVRTMRCHDTTRINARQHSVNRADWGFPESDGTATYFAQLGWRGAKEWVFEGGAGTNDLSNEIVSPIHKEENP